MVIEPVTRIEGNAKIEIKDDKVFFRVLEFRGFEKFLEGRSFEYIPAITARICGICPVAHAVASARAIENAFDIEVSERVEDLRRILLLAQTIQSHALHFFFLTLPDYFKAKNFFEIPRNLVSLGIELRKVANSLVEKIAVRAVHPELVVGGVARDLRNPEKSIADLKNVLSRLLEKFNDIEEILKPNECKVINETGYLALTKDGLCDYYGNKLKAFASDTFEFEPNRYREFIEEYVESYTYTKFPRLKGEVFRVGALARLNLTELDTDLAKGYSKHFKTIRHETELYNYARLVEIVYCLEKSIEILENLRGGEIRCHVKPKGGRGVGVVEAPRGTLIHDYEFNERGLIMKVNIITPTTMNNPAIDIDLNTIYKSLRDPTRLEKIVRMYDPCLSCSTH